MQIVFPLLAPTIYIYLPIGFIGWMVWLLVLGFLGYVIYHSDEPLELKKGWKWIVFGVLCFTTLIATLSFGFQLPSEYALPVPGAPIDSPAPTLMIFSALPWVLAAGFLGPIPAVILGLISGLFTGLWNTHSPFTLIEIAWLALLFSLAIRQSYRTVFYRLLRHPLFAAIILSLAFSPIYIFTTFFAVNESLAVRLDYSLTLTWPLMITRGIELIIAGGIGEIIYLKKPKTWGRNVPLQPSPSEANLQLRFFYYTAPLIGVLMLTLAVGNWVAAGNAAKNMVNDRLSSITKVAAISLPYFLETGQNLIQELATENLTMLPELQVGEELDHQLHAIPYFKLLFLLDSSGNPISGYPIRNINEIQLTQEEKAGVKLALKGVPIQTYTLPARLGEVSAAQVSFIASIPDKDGNISGVLLGRTDLSSNPFTQPVITALMSVTNEGGEGIILDENNHILFDTTPKLVMSEYLGRKPDQTQFYEEMSSQGIKRLVYFQPVLGRPWSVILAVPLENAQQYALEIALPSLVILLVISITLFVLLRLGLRSVTYSLKSLANEATLIAQGQLEHSLLNQGEDEVGRFSKAFEKMRISLKARLEELNKLLHISQGVASNLQVEVALKPILEAALINNACMARAVLIPEVRLDRISNSFFGLGAGHAADLYNHLDSQLFDLLKQSSLFSIPNIGRTRRLTITPNQIYPGALIAFPIHQDNIYYGVLWIGFNEPHNFTEEEVRFLGTLAGQAALAAANARLYATSEIGRQRLEAVLSSTPEPVFVIDENTRLFLLNPAALQVPGLLTTPAPGRLVNEVVTNPQLIELIKSSVNDRLITQEITLPNHRVYFASVSPVTADGQLVGKICMLRDITHYKELDTLKSDFVSLVSHDLRAPLTLMRGYATMLQMVGDLNDQQKLYVEKIVIGVENMSRLVSNLLDLGRIEAGIGLQIERVAGEGLVEAVLNSLQPMIKQKSIQIKQVISSDMLNQPKIFIEADQALLQQAFYNLVENAIKYTRVGGVIDVRLNIHGDHTVFEVRDNGIGIAPLDLPHLFEKFYRSGRREAYSERGTGLGLAIVKSIAERHGGRVWVESQLGKGSTFYLDLPLKQPYEQNTPKLIKN